MADDRSPKIEDVETPPSPEVTVNGITPATSKSVRTPLIISRSGAKCSYESAVEELSSEIQDQGRTGTIDRLKELCEKQTKTYFEIGGYLVLVKEKVWYKPLKSFSQFVRQELNLEPRRAEYYIAIYHSMTSAKVNWSQFQHLGWSKMRLISPVVTHDNSAEWLEIASESTFIELGKRVREVTAHAKPGDAAKPKVTASKHFKLRPNEAMSVELAIAKVKKANAAATDSAALVIICESFVAMRPMEALVGALQPVSLQELLTTVLSKYQQSLAVEVLQRVAASLQAAHEPVEHLN